MSDQDLDPIGTEILDSASDPKQFRRETEEVVGYYEGEFGGHLDTGQELNLNAIAIGLGLEAVEYEPEMFPGLIYRLMDIDTTVVLFGDGQLTVVDAPSEDLVNQALKTTIETIETVGLGSDLPDSVDVTVVETESDPTIPPIDR